MKSKDVNKMTKLELLHYAAKLLGKRITLLAVDLGVTPSGMYKSARMRTYKGPIAYKLQLLTNNKVTANQYIKAPSSN